MEAKYLYGHLLNQTDNLEVASYAESGMNVRAGMSSTTKIIIAVVVLVIIATVVYFVFFKKKKEVPVATEEHKN